MPTGVYKRSKVLKKQISNTLKRKWKLRIIKPNKSNWKQGHIPWNKGKEIWCNGKVNPFKGKHHTKKTKEINRQKHLGKKHTIKTRKQMSKSKIGHITTEETKKKIGVSNKGKNNGMWLGGKSFELYGIEFNKQLKILIKERDNYKCQLCFKKGKVIHHIDYNKQNNSLKNLILLCQFCHTKTNFNRKDWKRYFRRKFK